MTVIECRSSWIRRLLYVPLDEHTKIKNADGFLLVVSQTGASYAYAVPKWVPGLMAASKSKGRAYGKLVRGKFPSVQFDYKEMQ